MRRHHSCVFLALVAVTLGSCASAEAAARPVPGIATRSGAAHRAPAIIDNMARMDVNNLDMVVTNHGSYAYDLLTGNAGLVYPRGSTHTMVFAGGLWIGAKVAGQVRVSIGDYSQEYVPGPMVGETFLPDRPAFRSYRIERGGVGYADYLANAVPQGAPLDAQGNPILLGDATIWNVFNDADPLAHTNQAGRTAPLGVEVQQTVFAFDRAGPLGNVIFIKWKLINKGRNTLDSAYVSIWSDPDVGGFTDDLVGCDTTLALGYCYNATNSDAQYGSAPPAVGFDLLRGPVVQRAPGVYDTLGLAAFSKYINGTDPASADESYHYMRGLHADGTPVHEFDIPSAPITTFMLSGDPVAGTGWVDSYSADCRMQLSTGPFTMAPGDSQEVITAVLVGQGMDRLSSITALRAVDAAAKLAYREAFEIALSISAPPTKVVDEGQTLSFTVASHDPGGTATLSASGLPLGASFLDNGDGTGMFQWTPAFNQAGMYTVTFTAHGAGGATADAPTVMTVRDVNRRPVANAGGPYTSFVGAPIAFDGGGSFDPDGEALSYTWNFGDGATGSGRNPSHTYTLHGLYGVALTVSDGRLTDIATTTAEVVDRFLARAFTEGGNRSIRLGTGKPRWCVQIEPIGRSFDVLFLDVSTIVMKSSGTGAVDQIPAIVGKTVLGVDRDGNGVEEATVCFGKDDLVLLFSDVHGHQSVPVTIEGRVVTGGEFRAALDVAVTGSGGALAVALDPNPMNAGGSLRFVTKNRGRVTVSLFDLSGRRVRSLWESASTGGGLHRVPVDGRDDAGRSLGSGIYFYRIETPEGAVTGRFTIVR